MSAPALIEHVLREPIGRAVVISGFMHIANDRTRRGMAVKGVRNSFGRILI